MKNKASSSQLNEKISIENKSLYRKNECRDKYICFGLVFFFFFFFFFSPNIVGTNVNHITTTTFSLVLTTIVSVHII